MAIAFDSAQSRTGNLTPPTSQTWSHTVTGSDTILFVHCQIISANAITGATYNGVGMTLVDSQLSLGDLFGKAYLFVLINPATGANTVSVQTSGSTLGACYGSSSSYTGAAQSAQPPHDNKNVATTTALTTSIDTSSAPSTDNCWIVGGYKANGNNTTTAGAGTTFRSAGNWNGIMDNNVAITPAGSDSLVVNTSSSSEIAVIMASIAPVAASGPATLKTLNTTATANIKTINGTAIANIKSINTII